MNITWRSALSRIIIENYGNDEFEREELYENYIDEIMEMTGSSSKYPKKLLYNTIKNMVKDNILSYNSYGYYLVKEEPEKKTKPKISKGHQRVKDYLNKIGIKYEEEKTMPGMEYNNPLRYDFYCSAYQLVKMTGNIISLNRPRCYTSAWENISIYIKGLECVKKGAKLPKNRLIEFVRENNGSTSDALMLLEFARCMMRNGRSLTLFYMSNIKKVIRREHIVKINDINFAIEYDGEGHYIAIEVFGGEKGLEITRIRDNAKNDYSRRNGILIFRIPYFKFDVIEQEIDRFMRKHGIFARLPDPDSDN